jgi:hypothetical protein
MNKNTRIKSFKGLPHSLGGLDYTDDAEVEHNENAYRPLGSDNEFIFRNTSIHTKELEKEDKLRKNRPVGDRISDQSFDNAAQKIIMKEIKDLIKEGKDPFNTEGQNAFKQGGVKYAIGGARDRYSVPTMGNSAPDNGGLDFNFTPNADPMFADPGRYNNASVIPDTNASSPRVGNQNSSNGTNIASYAAAVGRAAGGITEGLLDTELQNEQISIFDNSADAVMGNIPVVGQFYNAGNQLNEPIKDWQADATKRSGANSAEATIATALSGLVDPMDGWSQNAAAYEAGIISESEAAGNMIAQFFLPGFANQSINRATDKHRAQQEKQAGYDTTLAARDRFEGSPETTRTRYNDQVQMKNGGVRKQYSGKDGSVRNILGENDFWNPSEQDMLAGNMSYIPYANKPDNLKVTSGLDESYLDPSNFNNFSAEEQYTTAPIDPVTAINEEYTTAPDGAITDKKGKKLTSDQIKQLYQGILGFGANAAGSIAYLASEGKNYDKVKYPTYRPENMTAETQLREARDQSASTIEALRQQGKLDPAALEQLATSGSKATAGIRENVANFNIGNRNQAQQFNIGTDIRSQQDEAANKGVAIKNYYDEINNTSKAAGIAINQAGKIDNDKMILAMYENIFGKNKVV